MSRRHIKKIIIIFTILLAFGSFFLWLNNPQKPQSDIVKLDFAAQDFIDLPLEIKKDDQSYFVTYSMEEELQNKIIELIKKNPSDYTSVAIIDNNTGNIISAIDHEKMTGKFGHNIVFSASSPAASLFKVITSIALIESNAVNANTMFAYTGRATTLYKSQLEKTQPRWERKLTLEQAFAKSNNVVFGKAAIAHLSAEKLYKTAEKLEFNKSIIEGFPIDKSFFPLPTDRYNLAELASGLNTSTMISPVHAAKIAAIIANDGMNLPISLVKEIKDSEGHLIFNGVNSVKRDPAQVLIDQSSVNELKEMMRLAVTEGTARDLTRKMNKNIKNNLEIGGKTGAMTGGIPHGRRDWLMLYAKPKTGLDKGISMAIMLVNMEKWQIKSNFLAKEILEHYYSKFKINPNRLTQN